MNTQQDRARAMARWRAALSWPPSRYARREGHPEHSRGAKRAAQGHKSHRPLRPDRYRPSRQRYIATIMHDRFPLPRSWEVPMLRYQRPTEKVPRWNRTRTAPMRWRRSALPRVALRVLLDKGVVPREELFRHPRRSRPAGPLGRIEGPARSDGAKHRRVESAICRDSEIHCRETL